MATRRDLAAAIAFALIACVPTIVCAQSPPPLEDSIRVRRANVAQDEPQAQVLFWWGAGSLALGAAEGIAGVGGDAWRWYGANSAVWGLIDCVIAGPWVLGAWREQRSVITDATLTGDARAASWRQALARSHTQERSFAINLALDVLYVAGGTVLWYFADRTHENWHDFGVGAGAAAVTQGGFLLVFDLVGFGLAHQRTARLGQAVP